MANTSLLGSFGGVAGDALMFRNVLINGDFSVWQRGTSQTTDGYGSDDRWVNQNNGSTKTHSQQAFTLGQTDVPGNPQFFSRTVVSSVAGANNYVLKSQRIENVRTLAGQTATLSFWAKADAAKNITVEFEQFFGSGGSPSAGVTGIGVTTIALTTSWRYYTVTISIPSISGKTLGTLGNDFLQCIFWFDAGSTYNARTNSLGQQSGTFDIANAQLEAGPTATPFERRPIGVETALAQRYYERLGGPGGDIYKFVCISADSSNTASPFIIPYKVEKRTANVTFTYGGNFASVVGSGTVSGFAIQVDGRSTSQFAGSVVGTGFTVGAVRFIRTNNDANAFLAFDAEL